MRSSGFPTIFDTNRPVQLHKKDRSLKTRIYEEEESYYLCIEDKVTDELCSYCTADLRLCFHIDKIPIFS